jgi:hypothetical protein
MCVRRNISVIEVRFSLHRGNALRQALLLPRGPGLLTVRWRIHCVGIDGLGRSGTRRAAGVEVDGELHDVGDGEGGIVFLAVHHAAGEDSAVAVGAERAVLLEADGEVAHVEVDAAVFFVCAEAD